MSVLSVDYFSNALRRFTSFKMVLPNDFPPEMTMGNAHYQRPMKTLYLLHGYSGMCTDWLWSTKIFELAGLYNLAIVCPSGENSFYLDAPETGHAYGTFVGEELPLYVQQVFNLSPAKSDNFIGGFSMGGFGALHAAFAYPERFSAVAAFSAGMIQHNVEKMKPGFEDEIANYEYYRRVFGAPEELAESTNNPEFQIKQLQAQGIALPRLFLCVGTEDPVVYNENQIFRSFLTEHNVDFTYNECPGVHDFNFVSGYLEKALQFMMEENQ